MTPVHRPLRFNASRSFVSASWTHRIAEPPAVEQCCTHALIVRWREGWRGIVWQVQR